ncbi:MAG TPA: hypothetical protein VFY05_04775 [Candidatus Angelobacter sp.]|nr:hypothetical protein [Candidatus Angelobacter sp.]
METKKRFNASQASGKFLKSQGYAVQNVEQTIRWPKKNGRRDEHGRPLEWEMVKKDLWGFADLVAVKIGEKGTIYIQTTTADHAQDRIQKIAGIVEARTILDGGNRIHVHAWKQKGGNGKPKSRHLTVTGIKFDEDGILETEELYSGAFSESRESQEEMDFRL